MKSAQNQFPVITQAERMVDRTVKPVEEMIAEERESSSAQIRTLLLRVQLGVQEVEGKDSEEQVEVGWEKRVKEGAP